LSEKELKWLDKFNAEYIGAGKELKKENRPLHRTKKLRKDCYDRNNSRNRDILTQQEAQGKIKNLEEQLKVCMNPMERLELFLDLRSQGYLDENGEFTLKLKDFEDGDDE
jgi:hypothetical protein